MDKLITLCWECRKLLKDHYRVDEYGTELASPGTDRGGKRRTSCNNCGATLDLRVCRIRTKPERGSI